MDGDIGGSEAGPQVVAVGVEVVGRPACSPQVVRGRADVVVAGGGDGGREQQRAPYRPSLRAAAIAPQRWFQCRGAAQADVQRRVELSCLGEDLAQGPGADRDQQRALGVTACPDSPVGCDPGEVSVSELAQHGPRHLVGLGQERERCALVIALVVLGCLLRLGDEVGDLVPELGVAGGLPEPPGRIDTRTAAV